MEFTHPAGSAHYQHISLSVMSHTSDAGGERKCGFLSERETHTERDTLSAVCSVVSFRHRIISVMFRVKNIFY